jgi:hypothetical protein
MSRKSDTGKFILSIMYDLFIEDETLSLDYLKNKILSEIVPVRKSNYKIPYSYQSCDSFDFDCDDDVETPKHTKTRKTKTRKTKPAPSVEPKEALPSNIREFTLPDGSVVYVNTEETEMSEESVIDSIIKPK